MWGLGSPRRKAPCCRSCQVACFSGILGNVGGRMSAAVHKILKCKCDVNLLQGTRLFQPVRISLGLNSYDKIPLSLKITCIVFQISTWNALLGLKLFDLRGFQGLLACDLFSLYPNTQSKRALTFTRFFEESQTLTFRDSSYSRHHHQVWMHLL